jgi:hypothetical protein
MPEELRNEVLPLCLDMKRLFIDSNGEVKEFNCFDIWHNERILPKLKCFHSKYHKNLDIILTPIKNKTVVDDLEESEEEEVMEEKE